MKKTIYVKDKAIWGKIEAAAKEKGISVSELLLSSWSGSQLNRIEAKLDRLLGGAVRSEGGGKAPVRSTGSVGVSKNVSAPKKKETVKKLKAELAGRKVRKPVSEMKSSLYNPTDEGAKEGFIEESGEITSEAWDGLKKVSGGATKITHGSERKSYGIACPRGKDGL